MRNYGTCIENTTGTALFLLSTRPMAWPYWRADLGKIILKLILNQIKIFVSKTTVDQIKIIFLDLMDDSHISTIILVTGFGIELSEFLALHSEKQSNCLECARNLLTQFLFAHARVACHHNNNRVAKVGVFLV
jgi:hypothetical protein